MATSNQQYIIYSKYKVNTLAYSRHGRNQLKISAGGKVISCNDDGVIDAQSTMMWLFCCDQLTNSGGGTFS